MYIGPESTGSNGFLRHVHFVHNKRRRGFGDLKDREAQSPSGYKTMVGENVALGEHRVEEGCKTAYVP